MEYELFVFVSVLVGGSSCVCESILFYVSLYMHCTFVHCICSLIIVNDFSGASFTNSLSEHSLAVHKELLCSVTPYLLNSDTLIRISE